MKINKIYKEEEFKKVKEMLMGVKDIIPEICLAGQQNQIDKKIQIIKKKQQLKPVEVPNLLKGNKQSFEINSILLPKKKEKELSQISTASNSITNQNIIKYNDVNKKIIFDKNIDPKIIVPKEKLNKNVNLSNSINEKNFENLDIESNSEINSSASSWRKFDKNLLDDSSFRKQNIKKEKLEINCEKDGIRLANNDININYKKENLNYIHHRKNSSIASNLTKEENQLQLQDKFESDKFIAMSSAANALKNNLFNKNNSKSNKMKIEIEKVTIDDLLSIKESDINMSNNIENIHNNRDNNKDIDNYNVECYDNFLNKTPIKDNNNYYINDLKNNNDIKKDSYKKENDYLNKIEYYNNNVKYNAEQETEESNSNYKSNFNIINEISDSGKKIIIDNSAIVNKKISCESANIYNDNSINICSINCDNKQKKIQASEKIAELRLNLSKQIPLNLNKKDELIKKNINKNRDILERNNFISNTNNDTKKKNFVPVRNNNNIINTNTDTIQVNICNNTNSEKKLNDDKIIEIQKNKKKGKLSKSLSSFKFEFDEEDSLNKSSFTNYNNQNIEIFNKIVNNQISLDFHEIFDFLESLGLERHLEVFLKFGYEDFDKILEGN